MKTFPFFSPVAGRLLVIGTLALPLAFSACHKDGDSSENTVTSQEAGQIMAQAVDPETGGFVLQTEFTANVSANNARSLFCGVRKDTTVTGTFSGPNRSFTYNLSWSRLLTCNNNVPSSYEHTFTGSTSYSIPAMSSNDSSTGSFLISGLEPSSNQLTLKQTYSRTGTQQSNTSSGRSFTSKVMIESNGVIIDKTTRMIVSGTANITVSGQASSGETFNYAGVLTFLGNRKAALAVSGGSAFTITW